MSNLRTALIKLAHSRPELRADILPLLTSDNTVSRFARRASIQKHAHLAMLEPMGLDARAAERDMGAMLYYISAEKNHSKFYEMLIIPSTSGIYTLIKKWGALTDSPAGNAPEKVEDFMSLQKAQAMLSKTYREKVGKGYVDAFNSKTHVAPGEGGKTVHLPKGQYPVGLNRTVGFGWGTQSATKCLPSLHTLKGKIDGALEELTETSDLSMLLADLQGADRIITELMKDRGLTNKGLGDLLSKMLSTPMNRIEAIHGMSKSSPGRPIMLDRKKLRTELAAISSYLGKQLSHC